MLVVMGRDGYHMFPAYQISAEHSICKISAPDTLLATRTWLKSAEQSGLPWLLYVDSRSWGVCCHSDATSHISGMSCPTSSSTGNCSTVLSHSEKGRPYIACGFFWEPRNLNSEVISFLEWCKTAVWWREEVWCSWGIVLILQSPILQSSCHCWPLYSCLFKLRHIY